MDDKTKALANDIMEQCKTQGLSFKQMEALLVNIKMRMQSAASEMLKQKLEETCVNLKPF